MIRVLDIVASIVVGILLLVLVPLYLMISLIVGALAHAHLEIDDAK
jgi:hypothetical protein